MDFSNRYARMCEGATPIQKEWRDFPHELRYGTLFIWRSFIGVLVPTAEPRNRDLKVLPEVQVSEWLRPKEDLIIIAKTRSCPLHDCDKGTPLYRQDQLQYIVSDSGYRRFSLIELFYRFANKEYNRFNSMEQLWLAFVMHNKFGYRWSDTLGWTEQ